MGDASESHEQQDIIARAAAGDEGALTALYRRHQPVLLRFLFGLAGDASEDLAAETWIAAARALGGFEGDDAAFRSLLLTIGRRRAVDHARARGRRRTVPVDPGRLPEPGPAPDPAELVTEAEGARAAIRRIGALLPRDQAEVVLLRVVAGLGVAEVAAIVGRSRAAVSVLQTRGLKRLASALGQPGRAPVGGSGTAPQVSSEFGPVARNVQGTDPSERWHG